MAEIIELASRRQSPAPTPSSASTVIQLSNSGVEIIESIMGCEEGVVRLWRDLDRMASMLSTIEDEKTREKLRKNINENRFGLVVAAKLLAQRTDLFCDQLSTLPGGDRETVQMLVARRQSDRF